MKRSALALLLLMFLVVGSCAAHVTRVATTPVITPSRELVVMSFNIRYGTAPDGENRWEKRRGMVMDVIRSHDPDVIGLQEALRFQIDEIRSAVPGYDEVGVGREDGQRSGEYSAILFKRGLTLRNRAGEVSDRDVASGTFWLSETPDVPGSKHWGNRITRVCTWVRLGFGTDGPSFAVFNTHLDHESEHSRRKSVELIAARIMSVASGDPVIVTGDFNCGETSRGVRFLKGEIGRAVETGVGGLIPGWCGLVDTFRSVEPGTVNVRTFHAFKGVGDTSGRGGPGGALTDKIDYVLVNGWFDTRSASIDRTNREGRYPSDHFPVVARVRLRAQCGTSNQ